QRRRYGRKIEQAAVVQAEIEENLFKLENAAHTEHQRHVALEHAIDDILAQQLLRECHGVDEGRLRETAAQQMLVEVADQRTRIDSDARALCRGPACRLRKVGRLRQ